MGKRLIEVMIVDNFKLMREGLTKLLESESYINVVAEAKNAEEAIRKALKYNPDIILLDIDMPGINGMEVLRSLKDLEISSKIIIVTICEGSVCLFQAMKMGIGGYVMQDSDSDHLIKTIIDVSQGEVCGQFDKSSLLTKEKANILKGVEKDLLKIQALSNREYEVLLLIAEGFTNRDIGEKLFISEKTVKNHVSSIFKKIEVKDRLKAAIFAYKTKIKEI